MQIVVETVVPRHHFPCGRPREQLRVEPRKIVLRAHLFLILAIGERRQRLGEFVADQLVQLIDPVVSPYKFTSDTCILSAVDAL